MELRWGLTSLGDAPSGFEYRYKLTVVADSAFTNWRSVGGQARSVTIPGNRLITGADYTFEVRSFGSGVMGSVATTDSGTARYTHRTRGC